LTGRQRGRPRDRTRDEAILRTTVELLNEVGLAGLRIQDVADRAGVGPGTIYRRWDTKEYLIVAALQWSMEQGEAIDAGPAQPDFRARALELVDILRSDEAKIVPGIVAAMSQDPALADSFRAYWLEPRIKALKEALSTIGGSGLPDDVADLLAEMIPAYLSLRFFLSHETVDKKFIDRLTQQLVLPVIKAHTDAVLPGKTPPLRRPD
jgi:AcrR family transcriptional regulator